MKLAELRKQRAAAFDLFKALADQPTLSIDEQTDYEAKKRAVTDLDGQIKRALEAQELAAATARRVEVQTPMAHGIAPRQAVPQQRVYAALERDAYVSDDAAARLAEIKGFRH